jgi:hypothetical protein
MAVIDPGLRGAGAQGRPCLRVAAVSPRSGSLSVPRALTDCGAAPALGQVPKKLQEHYGSRSAVSPVREGTEGHGAYMREQQARGAGPVRPPGWAQQIGERAGALVPSVTPETAVKDKREQKTLHWQAARLALGPAPGSVTPKVAATFGDRVNASGEAWRAWAVAAGGGTNPRGHGVGDGAPWIAEQFVTAFGPQAS